ncbi:MAG TPA: divalent metal cation transporter, partial [Dictyobacter sp.]|nr:divalent metal cation transporter [Dictyobacter sp.]
MRTQSIRSSRERSSQEANEKQSIQTNAIGITSSPLQHILLWTAIIGPGLMVMFADTDAGSIITAAQSGAQWGYRMILPQLILIPILYVVQEITVRLGMVTHKGHGELIREHFGFGWAIISVGTLFVASIGALVTEFAGIAGVGEMLHISPWITVPFVTVLLVAIGLSGSYKRVERIGLAIGVLELFFLVAALLVHPSASDLAFGLTHLPIMQKNYLFLLAANVGAVIMPWMVFYQQGAVIDKHLKGKGELKVARWDTWLGAILTQVVMIAVVIAMAATIGHTNPGASLNTIQDIAAALVPVLGSTGAILICGLGMAGAGLLASLVVSLAGAWGIGEAFHLKHSLNLPFKEAKGFYIIYTLAHIGGAIFVLSGLSLINLTIDIEIMNALLLPIVLGFLLVLERVALPAEQRMHGMYKWSAWTVSALVMSFGLYMVYNVIAQL